MARIMREKLIGKTKEHVIKELQKWNHEWRTASTDGRHHILTADMKPERYNLIVVEGKVTDIYFG